jgi:hypothetical protein
MAEIMLIVGMKPFFFFQQEMIELVIFACRGNNGCAACHLDKERKIHTGVKTEIVWAHDEKMWKDEKTQKKKEKRTGIGSNTSVSL